MENSETKPVTSSFQLSKSGLKLGGTRLSRRKETGEVVAEFELSEISVIEFRTKRDPAMVVIAAAFALVALALVAGFRSSILAWTGAALCACIAGAFFLGSFQPSLAFTVGKSMVEFPILDSAEDGRAFVLMLQQNQRRPSRY